MNAPLEEGLADLAYESIVETEIQRSIVRPDRLWFHLLTHCRSQRTNHGCIHIHRSSGNVFADIGLPDAETHLLKAQIVAELYRLKTERGLSQTKAGAVMGITQPEVSQIGKAPPHAGS